MEKTIKSVMHRWPLQNADREDLRQDLALKLLTIRELHVGSPKAYVSRVALNILIDNRRPKATQHIYGDPEAVGDEVGEGDHVEEAVGGEIDMGRAFPLISAVLPRLEPAQANAFWLRHAEGLRGNARAAETKAFKVALCTAQRRVSEHLVKRLYRDASMVLRPQDWEPLFDRWGEWLRRSKEST